MDHCRVSERKALLCGATREGDCNGPRLGVSDQTTCRGLKSLFDNKSYWMRAETGHQGTYVFCRVDTVFPKISLKCIRALSDYAQCLARVRVWKRM